jgi:hypothetical protein
MPVAAWGAAPDSTTAPPPVVVTPPTGPDFPRGRISGYMFGDLYYNTVGDPNHVYDASGNDAGKAYIDNVPKPISEGLNGAQLRRVYFQLDNDLSIRFATRFRLEADSKSLTSDGKLGVAVKAAYLQVKSVLPRNDFFFGMVATPTFENSEEFWQYRSIEKTIADFRGVAPSADLGAELKGFVDSNHHFGYAALVGNGAGQKPEANRYKRYYLTLPIRFGDLRVEPYVDYENYFLNVKNVVAPVDTAAGNYDRATYKVFAGYEFRRAALGVEALTQTIHQPIGGSLQPRGISVFGRGTLTPTVAAFARFDQWVPDNNAANRIDSQLWIAGFDWQPFRDIHIEPNVEATQYIKKGNPANFPAHHDFQARITFFYKFSKPQS